MGNCCGKKSEEKIYKKAGLIYKPEDKQSEKLIFRRTSLEKNQSDNLENYLENDYFVDENKKEKSERWLIDF